MADGKTCDCPMHGKAGEPAGDCKMADGKACDCAMHGKAGEPAGADCPMHGKMGAMHGTMGAMHGTMGGAGPMDPAAHAAQLTEALGLDADQAAKVQALFAEFAPRQQAIRDRALALHQEMDGSHERGEKMDPQALAGKKAAFAAIHQEKAELHRELATAIEALLTPEQRTRHQQLMAEHHGPGGPGGPACGGSCGGAGGCGAHGGAK
jgi:hypothetical protein